jgi:hypothetical protein
MLLEDENSDAAKRRRGGEQGSGANPTSESEETDEGRPENSEEIARTQRGAA